MGNIVVITGANRGIGLAMAREFKAQGDTIYAMCRQSSHELTSLGVNVIEGVDVATNEGMHNIIKACQHLKIDTLVCNAGILRDESLNNLNLDTIREQFEVNALAPLNVVASLVPQLNIGAKIALITSRMGSIADNTSGGRFGYRMSKAALNAAAVSLAHDLKPNNIAIGIYHPGYVQTDMVNYGGDITATESAQRLVGLVNNLSLSESGIFKHSDGSVLPW